MGEKIRVINESNVVRNFEWPSSLGNSELHVLPELQT